MGSPTLTREEVLAELAGLFRGEFRVDVDEFTKEEIALAAGRKASAIYDRLHDWVLAGEITQRRLGNRFYYKLPPDKVRDLMLR